MHYELTGSQWDQIKHMLPGQKNDPGRTAEDNRMFISAIMWVARNGAAWRALPNKYGKWNSVHRRFIRWSKAGIWQMIFNTLAMNSEIDWVMIDTTIIRAQHHSAGARKKYSQWYRHARAGDIKRRFHYEDPCGL